MACWVDFKEFGRDIVVNFDNIISYEFSDNNLWLRLSSNIEDEICIPINKEKVDNCKKFLRRIVNAY